ncbi:unnamed protein product, partial [Prorocentrum cordatum]
RFAGPTKVGLRRQRSSPTPPDEGSLLRPRAPGSLDGPFPRGGHPLAQGRPWPDGPLGGARGAAASQAGLWGEAARGLEEPLGAGPDGSDVGVPVDAEAALDHLEEELVLGLLVQAHGRKQLPHQCQRRLALAPLQQRVADRQHALVVP